MLRGVKGGEGVGVGNFMKEEEGWGFIVMWNRSEMMGTGLDKV